MALGCFALRRADRADRSLGWRVAGWVALAASFDEVAQIHERTGKILGGVGGDGGGGLSVFVWLVPGGVLMVAILVALVRFTHRLDRRIAVRLLLGAGLFFFGAVGIEALGGAEALSGSHHGETLAAVEQGRLYLATTAVEEAFELTGEVLLILTVAAAIQGVLASPGGTVQIAVEAPLQTQ